jgi:hypothetical protein
MFSADDSVLPVRLYFVISVVVPRLSLLWLEVLGSCLISLTSLMIRRAASLAECWVLLLP